MGGSFAFSFFGKSVDISANLNNFNERLCASTFSLLPAVDEATCQLETVNSDDGSGSFLVRFESWSVALYENNIYSHSGRPDVADMTCESTLSVLNAAVEPKCVVQDADSGGAVPGTKSVLSGRFYPL